MKKREPYRKLRPYQSTALRLIPERFAAKVNRQLVKWPTGMGKTVLFSNLPQAMNLQGRMMVLAHREELITSACDKIRYWNPTLRVGIEKAEQHSRGEDIVVSSVATLGCANSKRIQKFRPEDFEIIVIDEAHHAVAKSYQKIVRHFRVYEERDRLLLGVTATPNRSDGQGLCRTFEEIVHDYSILDAINEGWLVNLRGLAVRTRESLDQVGANREDFKVGELARAINTPQRNDLVVRTWLEKAGDRRTVAFCADVQHALDLAKTFKGYGISAEAVWGDDPLRSTKLAMHCKGHIEVICNCNVLTEGYDDWQVSCIILARPTKSEGLYTQMVGRGTRIEEGVENLIEALTRGVRTSKVDCLILDFVDITSRHNLTTLASLFGLGTADLEGKTVTEAVKAEKEKKERKAAAAVPVAEKIDFVTEQVDLFKVQYAPEVLEFSKYQWIKVGASAYVLLIRGSDYLVVMQDVKGDWYISGNIGNNDIYVKMSSLRTAIEWADIQVRKYGGTSVVSLVSREAPWHSQPASEPMIRLAERAGINVPKGITKGDLSKKINERFALTTVGKKLKEINRKHE